MSPKAPSNFIQSVDRALQILGVFSSRRRELGVTEIANELNIHKSTVFGLLATLENRGFIQQNKETGKYKLGLKLFELGNLVQEGMDLRTIAAPYIAHLVEKHGETVHLVIHDQGEVIYIDKRDNQSNIRIISRVGSRLPMHCTGVGKCLLAYLPPEEIDNVISKGLHPFTPNTITDPERLKNELEKIRINGYSFDMEEIEMGLRCVAAPIRDYSGEVIAAISLSGPSIRMDEKKMEELVNSIKETAEKISQNLGYKT